MDRDMRCPWFARELERLRAWPLEKAFLPRNAGQGVALPLRDGRLRWGRSSPGEGRASSYGDAAPAGAQRDLAPGARTIGSAFVAENTRLTLAYG